MTSALGSSSGGDAVTVYAKAPQWHAASSAKLSQSHVLQSYLIAATWHFLHFFFGALASGALGSVTTDSFASDMP